MFTSVSHRDTPFSTLVLTNPMCVEILEEAWKNFSAVDAPTPTRGLKVLCLGLGSPSSSQIARIQLAFLAETCKRLEVVCLHFYCVSTFCACHDDYSGLSSIGSRHGVCL